MAWWICWDVSDSGCQFFFFFLVVAGFLSQEFTVVVIF